MRSWIKEPIILKNKDDMSIVFLFKTMVYHRGKSNAGNERSYCCYC